MMARHPRPSAHAQRGFTLVELMVAMTISLVITLVAASLLLVGSQGLNAVDATSDARDKERLAFEQLSSAALQAGYEDWGMPSATLQSVARTLGTVSDPEPDLFGWNNASFNSPADDLLSTTTTTTNGNRTSACGSRTTTACLNGSDVLAVRFQGSSLPNNANRGDGSMLDCHGEAARGLTSANLNERALLVFHVNVPSTREEPSLRCSVLNENRTWVTRPLLDGVESFQVLYGTDGVSPGIAAAANSADGVADNWLRADQLNVAGDAVGTRANWRRVRAVRIGLVVRAPVGSAVARQAQVLHPLGEAFASADDPGSALATAADGRLRTARTITLHLRNDLAMP
jgi:type IV pilus assembly protein PilW